MNLLKALNIKSAAKADSAPVGEAHTEFTEGGKLGPFQCGNCVHQRKGVCLHPVMNKFSQQPRDKNNHPKVDENDCCKFVRRPGE